MTSEGRTNHERRTTGQTPKLPKVCTAGFAYVGWRRTGESAATPIAAWSGDKPLQSTIDRIERERFAIAALELHQATERYYHTVLLVFTAYKPKTHNLETLGKRCADLHPALRGVFPQDTPEETRLFKLLKAAYVDARYKTSYSVSKQELEIIAGWVRELSERVHRVCREHIEELGRTVEQVDA